MPTAGRLIGAICFAILGGYIAFTTSPLFRSGSGPDFWYPLCIAAGIWAGWFVVGPRSGKGYASSVGLSLTGVFSQSFWILLILSSYQMITKSLRNAYEDPVDAIVNVFELLGEHALRFATLDVMIVLLVGAVISGVFTEFYARRLP